MSKFLKILLSTILILIISNFAIQLSSEVTMTNVAMAVISEEGGGGGCIHAFNWYTPKEPTCTTDGENMYEM